MARNRIEQDIALPQGIHVPGRALRKLGSPKPIESNGSHSYPMDRVIEQFVQGETHYRDLLQIAYPERGGGYSFMPIFDANVVLGMYGRNEVRSQYHQIKQLQLLDLVRAGKLGHLWTECIYREVRNLLEARKLISQGQLGELYRTDEQMRFETLMEPIQDIGDPQDRKYVGVLLAVPHSILITYDNELKADIHNLLGTGRAMNAGDFAEMIGLSYS